MFCFCFVFFSDDEFEPINVCHGREALGGDESEAAVNGVQPPLYLRDCMAGLVSITLYYFYIMGISYLMRSKLRYDYFEASP